LEQAGGIDDDPIAATSNGEVITPQSLHCPLKSFADRQRLVRILKFGNKCLRLVERITQLRLVLCGGLAAQ
jgi:hypothetical protein